jgi:DNA polymerase-2
MRKIEGWLLDLYTHPRHGNTCLWMIERGGARTCFYHAFPGIFYFTGNNAMQLQRAENFLYAQFSEIAQVRQEYVWQPVTPTAQTIFAVHTENPNTLWQVFRPFSQNFPGLDFYNVDLDVSHYYAAQHGLFAFCQLSIEVNELNHIQSIDVQDSAWSLDIEDPPLRIMKLSPNHNPRAQLPSAVKVSIDKRSVRLPFDSPEELARKVSPFLRQYDPDVILTDYGDGYLLQALAEGAKNWNDPITLNRDLTAPLKVIKERSYHSYGQMFYRPQSVLLAGRQHVDMQGSFFYKDSQLVGVLEVARVTAQSLQRTARTTPGTGISSMQIVEALRSNILVPYKKQLPERQRTAANLLQHDMGGFQLQPIIGLHANVGAVDFVSMYPSLMVRCNISPECTPHGLNETHDYPGLIPRTLEPLLKKRIEIKYRLMTTEEDTAQKQSDKMRSDALKWLLVTCFGYLGYKNARFGRIESHEAVTGAGRDAILLAKEVAEDMDFVVLHILVDSLFVQHPVYRKPGEFQPLLDEVLARTGIPISLDGVFRWVAFPPSRMDSRNSVPNRYFGVFQNGSIKVRGIEYRRRDTPLFIKETQMQVLRILAKAETLDATRDHLSEAFAYRDERRAQIASNRTPVEELVINHKLSRALEDYKVRTPASVAAQELLVHGKAPQPGETIQFLHTRGEPCARLWQPEIGVSAKDIDPRLYLRIFDRAMETALGLFQERFPDVHPRNHQYVLGI